MALEIKDISAILTCINQVCGIGLDINNIINTVFGKTNNSMGAQEICKAINQLDEDVVQGFKDVVSVLKNIEDEQLFEDAYKNWKSLDKSLTLIDTEAREYLQELNTINSTNEIALFPSGYSIHQQNSQLIDFQTWAEKVMDILGNAMAGTNARHLYNTIPGMFVGSTDANIIDLWQTICKTGQNTQLVSSSFFYKKSLFDLNNALMKKMYCSIALVYYTHESILKIYNSNEKITNNTYLSMADQIMFRFTDYPLSLSGNGNLWKQFISLQENLISENSVPQPQPLNIGYTSEDFPAVVQPPIYSDSGGLGQYILNAEKISIPQGSYITSIGFIGNNLGGNFIAYSFNTYNPSNQQSNLVQGEVLTLKTVQNNKFTKLVFGSFPFMVTAPPTTPLNKNEVYALIDFDISIVEINNNNGYYLVSLVWDIVSYNNLNAPELQGKTIGANQPLISQNLNLLPSNNIDARPAGSFSMNVVNGKNKPICNNEIISAFSFIKTVQNNLAFSSVNIAPIYKMDFMQPTYWPKINDSFQIPTNGFEAVIRSCENPAFFLGIQTQQAPNTPEIYQLTDITNVNIQSNPNAIINIYRSENPNGFAEICVGGRSPCLNFSNGEFSASATPTDFEIIPLIGYQSYAISPKNEDPSQPRIYLGINQEQEITVETWINSNVAMTITNVLELPNP